MPERWGEAVPERWGGGGWRRASSVCAGVWCSSDVCAWHSDPPSPRALRRAALPPPPAGRRPRYGCIGAASRAACRAARNWDSLGSAGPVEGRRDRKFLRREAESEEELLTTLPADGPAPWHMTPVSTWSDTHSAGAEHIPSPARSFRWRVFRDIAISI